jgi:hypothetical protein
MTWCRLHDPLHSPDNQNAANLTKPAGIIPVKWRWPGDDESLGPVTAQFVIEDHAVRHSWHHLARIRSAVGR